MGEAEREHGGPALRLRGVTKRLAGREVLTGVDLDVRPGETVALLGPNGAGKTTLLRIAAAVSRPTAGQVQACGVDAARNPDEARKSIGTLLQDAPADPDLTPHEHVRLWLRLRGKPAAPDEADALLADAGLARAAHQPARRLSRGQRQRLGLVLALAGDPQLALLDEPFAGLDGDGAAWLEAQLARRRARGALATVASLHDARLAARVADRAATLRGGRLDGGQPAAAAGGAAPASALPFPTASVPAPAAPLPARAFGPLLAHQLRREWRSKDALQAGLVLVATFLLVGLFAASDLRGEPRAAAVLLWAPLVYAGAAVLARGFSSDADRGVLDLLRTLPAGLAWHGHARTVAGALFCAAVAAAAAGGAAALFAVPLPWTLAAVLALAVAGLAIVGSLCAAIAAQARSREALLPILLVPALAPLLHAGVSATLTALGGGGWDLLRPVLLLMAGYDLAAAGVAWLLWPTVLEGD